MLSDLEIARQATLLPIADIAAQAGLLPSEIELNGPHKAKVRLDALRRLETSAHPKGKLVVVTAITPTPLGEGKTVTTIGASLGLAAIGKSVVTCIRQPSMGPVFGIKGGAAGGGRSQVVPMEDFNLHLTGDIHAIQAAHNLAAAALDSRLFHETRLGPEKFTARTSLPFLDIDPARILWNRVLDINDRSLRSIEIGLPFPGADPAAANDNGVPRRAGFDIAVASELMAILALASDLGDLRQRVGRVILALDRQGRPVTAERLGVAGAMTILMRDTVKPTLLQTLERTPCLVHAGPFANIAHGNSSIIADRLALRLADYVVTESGFGSDMGFEKFCNVKTRVSGQPPAAVVLVATLRALKMHSGQFRIIPGRPLPDGILSENSEALDAGLANLDAHIANARQFGVPVIVALNSFPTDTEAEIARIRHHALAAGAFAAVTSEVHAKGGEGGRELAEAIVAAADSPSSFRLLYPDDLPLVEKIRTIATSVYGASDINLFPQATAALAAFQAAGHGHLPVCMAKTHLSLSHDPARPGAPKDYIFPIREAHLSAGAGFIYVLADKIRTMPGLGSTPAYLNMDIDPDGNITGLS